MLEVFKTFHLMIKNATQKNIEILRTNNSGEYTSHVFEQYLNDNGIKHQTTTPYNPQQNGVAEHMNRTFLNMIRSMMFFKNVKPMFWGEAVLCAYYIRNCCLSFLINNKYPYEMWYNCLPIAQHFRVIGSICYALTPKHQCNNLGARCRKYIFLRYSATSKAYRLYDEEKKKFILSGDVIFLE